MAEDIEEQTGTKVDKKESGDGHGDIDRKKLNEKYKPIVSNDGQGNFEAHRVLIDDVCRDDDDLRILMSDIPMRMCPALSLLQTMETVGKPRNPENKKPLSQRWRESFYIHRPAINRGVRDDVLAIDQTQAANEENNIDKALKSRPL